MFEKNAIADHGGYGLQFPLIKGQRAKTLLNARRRKTVSECTLTLKQQMNFLFRQLRITICVYCASPL